jgi:predicted nucleotidyltransferase
MSFEQVKNVLARHPDIQLAYVFGSVARGTARPDSDLIAVQTTIPLGSSVRIKLVEDLAVATGRPVDLIDLRTAGEPLLGQILKHGQRIVGDDANHVALLRRHVFDMEDFVPYVQRMLDERRQAWIESRGHAGP